MVQCLLLCFTSWWDDFLFQSFQIAMPKREAESELLGDESCQKNAPKFLGRVCTEQFLCVVQSTQSAKHVKCSACFFSSWWNVQCRTTHQLEASHQQRKSDRKYAEDFPLICMGCDVIRAEMLFTNFFVVHNIALSAADHDICSGAHFCKSELRRTIYIRDAQNLITVFKI